MMFYRDCLGGELVFQTIGDLSLDGQMPKKMKDCILHSTLTNGNMVLLGSDMAPPSGLQKGNAISLALHCSSEEETRIYYQKLSAGGSADHPLEATFWGGIFGDLTDPFGNHWLIQYNKTKSSSK